jgi:hypothetical protein
MRIPSNVRARLCGVALFMAVMAACGGRDVEIATEPPAPASDRGWSKPFGAASIVLGQSGFDRIDPPGGTATPLPALNGSPALTSDGRLFVAAGGDVSAFRRYDAQNGASAEFMLSIPSPTYDVSVQNERLIVAHQENVLIYDPVPTADTTHFATAGEGSGCDDSLLLLPRSAYLTPVGRLIVADTSNNRVLIWDRLPAAGGPIGPASFVLGQQDMLHCAANDDNGDGNSEDNPSQRTLAEPSAVWSDGTRLVVADLGNHRVLIWSNIATVVNGQPANFVVGQQSFELSGANGGDIQSPTASTLFKPISVDVSVGGELAVTDQLNNRVLIWSELPKSNGLPARYVVGQSDFTHGAANDVEQTGLRGTLPSAKTLNFPTGARFHGRDLVVNDQGNKRVLVWRESD